jgi:2-haloacid dehalogenase
VRQPRAVIFDVGNVLYHWNPRNLYGRLISDDRALDAFLADVLTMEWHVQHDAGRRFAETAPELIARFPEHEALISAWGPRYQETMGPPVEGMAEIVADLDAAGVPLFAITNFSDEFWPDFRAARAEMFDRFGGVVVSGEERILKPDAAIYRLALERFALAAEEALFVDDSAANAEGARAVGMHAIRFTDAAALRTELEALGLLPGTQPSR